MIVYLHIVIIYRCNSTPDIVDIPILILVPLATVDAYNILLQHPTIILPFVPKSISEVKSYFLCIPEEIMHANTSLPIDTTISLTNLIWRLPFKFQSNCSAVYTTYSV